MENIQNTKLINNLEVTLKYTEQKDLELETAISICLNAKNLLKATEEFYTPKINAIGEGKWNLICLQLNNLNEAMKKGDIRRVSAYYWDGATGEQIAAYLANGHLFINNFNCNITQTYDATLPMFKYGMQEAGFITRWEEYKIYAKFRKSLISQLQSKTNIYQKNIEEVKNHFTEVQNHK